MNKLYADRNGVPVDSTKQDRATRAVNKMIETDRQSKNVAHRFLITTGTDGKRM